MPPESKRSLPGYSAIAVAVTVGAWLAVSFGAGLWPTGGPSSASAYQYQYSGSVTGSGTIASPGKGQVSFSVTAKLDNTGVTGSCSVVEPATKTKIKCLDATSITFATLNNGCTLADIQGHATLNGAPTTYEIQAVDCGTPGTGHDSFSITADGYQRSGTLTSGNLTVHGFG